MERNEREFSESYRKLSDTEFALLYQQADSLIDAARVALKAEMKRRGVSQSPLYLVLFALYEVAEFDRLQNEHRKRVLSFFLLVAFALMALFDFWIRPG